MTLLEMIKGKTSPPSSRFIVMRKHFTHQKIRLATHQQLVAESFDTQQLPKQAGS